MDIQVEIDGQKHSVGTDDVTLPENTVIADMSNPPKGLFNEDGVNSKVKQAVNKTKEKEKQRLLKDDDFNQSILHKHNVTLDDNGTPKELEADFDKEAWKANEAKKLTKPLKDKVEKLEAQVSQSTKKQIENDIQRTGNKLGFENKWLKERNGKIPLVETYRGNFDKDENGNTVLKDEDGFAKNGDGSNISVEEFFSQKDFSDMLTDKTQGGSGFENGSNGGKTFTDEQVANMSTEEFDKNKEDILNSMN